MDVICQSTGKLALPEFEAHTLMENLRPTDPRNDLLEVYPCEGGELPAHHHVGHRDPGGRRRPPGRKPPRAPGAFTQSLGDLLPAHLRALAEEAR